MGRDDGDVTVFSFDISPEPIVQFQTNVGESVRSVDAGQVSTPQYDEMVVASYSGRIVSYTTEPLSLADEGDKYGRAKVQPWLPVAAAAATCVRHSLVAVCGQGTVQREGRIQKLRKELAQLKGKVSKEQEKLSKYSEEFIPVQQQFKVRTQLCSSEGDETHCKREHQHRLFVPCFQVKTSFVLDPDEGAYKFTVEIPSNIDVVCATLPCLVLLHLSPPLTSFRCAVPLLPPSTVSQNTAAGGVAKHNPRGSA